MTMGRVSEKETEQLYCVHVMEPNILGLVCNFTIKLISFVSKKKIILSDTGNDMILNRKHYNIVGPRMLVMMLRCPLTAQVFISTTLTCDSICTRP